MTLFFKRERGGTKNSLEQGEEELYCDITFFVIGEEEIMRVKILFFVRLRRHLGMSENWEG